MKEKEANTAATKNTVSYSFLSTLFSLVNPNIHINTGVASDPHNEMMISGGGSEATPVFILILGFTNENSVDKNEYDTVFLVAAVLASLSFIPPSYLLPFPSEVTMAPTFFVYL